LFNKIANRALTDVEQRLQGFPPPKKFHAVSVCTRRCTFKYAHKKNAALLCADVYETGKFLSNVKFRSLVPNFTQV
jgi:hypothetical protein